MAVITFAFEGELTKSEVRSQPTPSPSPSQEGKSEVNPPLAPPPPRRGTRGFEQLSKNIAP
ncbi:MAG: hypothetical protein F6K48_15590 [Okeania sp. SIO3H1]|uniref:hypothetical protein n=1 Tax=Okeania sp. SIO1I7 TaxID=2607772 RepID=UPI0013CDBD85|nr:hypothetical protein [Okeania sp. SIO1I7]NEN90256.1 hypothetical protein [Okeania sp. SIO3H1]NET24579.1 hypothetical protein [Okeania sp. SIO1I7]